MDLLGGHGRGTWLRGRRRWRWRWWWCCSRCVWRWLINIVHWLAGLQFADACQYWVLMELIADAHILFGFALSDWFIRDVINVLCLLVICHGPIAWDQHHRCFSIWTLPRMHTYSVRPSIRLLDVDSNPQFSGFDNKQKNKIPKISQFTNTERAIEQYLIDYMGIPCLGLKLEHSARH